MTNDWSLPVLLDDLSKRVERDLTSARATLKHPVSKGDATESVWITMLSTYLPKRYEVRKAFVVDSEGSFSEQQDVVIHDRQYSPFIFSFQEQDIVPAESVYAIFETKQSLAAENVTYAKQKLASVRNLQRTSLPVPTVSGTMAAKPLHTILGGILTLTSDWNPSLGEPLDNHLHEEDEQRCINMGCVADSGYFAQKDDGSYAKTETDKAATAFLLELIAQLQTFATVPMIDVRAYARWL